jgi:hypothetical protein
MIEKKFFRVRLSGKCPVETKLINSVKLTRQWQMKTGDIKEFAVFPDVEVQAMAKRGNGFVPAEEGPGGAAEGSGDVSGDGGLPAQPGAVQAADLGKPADESAVPASFAEMTVEQLKNYLTAKGIAQSELRNTAKSDLIERAEFLWAQTE